MLREPFLVQTEDDLDRIWPSKSNGEAAAADFELSVDEVPWPESLRDEAYYGPAGEFTRLLEPHTEADPAALLIQFLAAFGNAAGRNRRIEVEGARHYPALFICLVGRSAKSRKGTSWTHVRNVVGAAAGERWEHRCVKTGLSSGEGLIYSVRDVHDETEDPGARDKRLLAFEPEFARTLRAAAREGSTLSAVLRSAWDDGHLRVLTRNSPLTATGAHITLIAHITRDELLRFLFQTEIAGGLANRVLWVCTKRSKLLPRGGNLAAINWQPFLRRLSEALSFASEVGEVDLAPGAWSLWEQVYSALSAERPGILGHVTARGEAQVLRLALIYALLDSTLSIEEPHLRAALEVWRYCFQSARWIWGTATGDPIADRILFSLQRAGDRGLAGSDLHAVVGRHVSAARLRSALVLLRQAGVLRCEREGRAGPGRPGLRFYVVESAN